MIDANCGWDADTAIRCVHELADCQLALVEQPTPDGDYAALARVRRETRRPVMADDMCFNLVHARELIRNDGCDVISVYPGKNGGIRKSHEIVEFAAAARRGLHDRLEPRMGRRHRGDGAPGRRLAEHAGRELPRRHSRTRVSRSADRERPAGDRRPHHAAHQSPRPGRRGRLGPSFARAAQVSAYDLAGRGRFRRASP